MFRSAFRTFSRVRLAHTQAGTAPSRRGRTALVLAGAAAAGTGAVYALTGNTAELDTPAADVSPSKFWSPPTREQMMNALKESSAEGLRHDGTSEMRKSLLKPQREASGSSPSPEVDHLTRSPEDESGFDLLVVGGGATGAGVAMDAATRGLRVALVERDDVDLVDVCTPGDTHEEIAVAALAAGKHVLCEKPLANTLEEAERMAEAARAAEARGQVAMVGSYEGRTTFGVGVRARLPMRVFTLDGPGTGSRLVIDVAHRW